MDFLSDVVRFFSDPATWTGIDGVPNRLWEHVQLSVFAIVCAALVAIPAGIFIGHAGVGAFLAVSVINIGRALPSFAILAVALPLTIRLGIAYGFWSTFAALFLLSLPPMFTNAYTAIRGVDPQSVDAARGMGLRERDVLARVELPLGAPVILAATRVAAVQVVATATLGAVIGWGGLGRFIIDGIAKRDFDEVFAGALLVALLAVVTELCFTLLERILLPKGVQRVTRADAELLGGRAA
jgi:osmoprotectant transport system permease protein